MYRLLLCLAALFGLSAPAFAAGVVVPAEQRHSPFSGELPPCDDAVVVWKAEYHFNDKEAEYWNPDLEIKEIVDIKEIGYRTNGVAYIPRRFCVGTAKLSDGVSRQIVYQVQQSLGFAGFTIGVEMCVIGLDRNYAYSPACSVLRPLLDRYAREKVRLTYP
jgi:hypothetical protein